MFEDPRSTPEYLAKRKARLEQDQYFILKVDSRKIKRVLEETGGWTPMMLKWTKPARKKKPVKSEVPIFPTWVILPFDNNHYHEHQKVVGVKGILRGTHKQPLLIPQDDLDRLKEIEGLMLVDPDKGLAWEETLEIGQEVTVDGVLGGVPATISSLKGDQVSVNIGGNYPIEVNRCLIRPKPL